ncbi:MAG: hypothetical protein ACYCXT_06510, partial [Acidiferrobacteraceae bacterium]
PRPEPGLLLSPARPAVSAGRLQPLWVFRCALGEPAVPLSVVAALLAKDKPGDSLSGESASWLGSLATMRLRFSGESSSLSSNALEGFVIGLLVHKLPRFIIAFYPRISLGGCKSVNDR